MITASHRRIGYLALRRTMPVGLLRPLGYRDALPDSVISMNPALLAHVDFDQPETGPQLLQDTIDRMLRLNCG